MSTIEIAITHIDTACILLEINGFRILTDPTLDQAGKLYHHGFGSVSRKTENPALDQVTLNDIDLVLLSHHQHKDNFDHKGKEFTKTVARVISTIPASKAMPGVIGLADWETYELSTSQLGIVKITATPAQHHPWWLPAFFAGKVIGFIIELEGQKNGAIYISGDTVYFDGIPQIAKRYNVDIGIFHVGSAQFPYLTGFGQYTMDSKDLLKAIKVLNPNTIIPIHHKGWTHFKESEASLRATLNAEEGIKNKTIFLKSGEPTSLAFH